MKLTDKNAVEIYNSGGAVAAGDWKNGSGNFVTPRPVPQKCIKIESNQIDSIKNENARIAARLLLQRRPKVRKIIVVNQWEEVEKLAAQ